jgi:hypothetical protein
MSTALVIARMFYLLPLPMFLNELYQETQHGRS